MKSNLFSKDKTPFPVNKNLIIYDYPLYYCPACGVSFVYFKELKEYIEKYFK
jgi:hypothetical protein